MKNQSRNLLISAAVAAILHSQVSRAQESPTPTAGGIEEVVITARKRAESIEDVPLAITAIGASEIQNAGMLDIQDVIPFVPGAFDSTQNVDRNDRAFRDYTIRGIIASNPLSTRQTANIFVDGVLDFGGNPPSLADVDHVEVVKGPQAAYFGRGTFGGAINFITKAPSLNDWSAKADVDAGSYDELTGDLSVEGPLIKDKLAIRVAARSYSTGGDYQDYGWPGQQLGARSTKSFTTTFLFKPVDAMTIRSFNTYWIDDDGPAANGAVTNANYNCNAGGAPAGQLNYYCGAVGGGTINPTSVTRGMYIDPTAFQQLQTGEGLPFAAPFEGANFINHIGLERKEWSTRNQFSYNWDNGYTLSGNLSADYNKWAFLQSSSYQDTRNVPNPAYGTEGVSGVNLLPYQYILIIGDNSDQDQNFEIRLASPATDMISWQVGLNYFHDKTMPQTCVSLTGLAFDPVVANGYLGCVSVISLFDNNTQAAFASVNYNMTKQLSLSVEGRYQSDKVGETDYPSFPSSTIETATNTNQQFTPRVSFNYKPVERTTYYISYAEGTLPVEFNTQLAQLAPYQQAYIAQQAHTELTVPPEKLQMEEIGAKGLYFDDTLQILADVYVGHWTGRHIPQTVFYPITQGSSQLSSIQVVSAGGIVDLHGIEFEGTYTPDDHWSFHLTAAWNPTNIRYTDSADALALTGNSDPVGKNLPLYAVGTGTFTVSYKRHAFEDFDGFGRIDTIYTGKIYDDEADVAWTAPATKVNFGIGISNEKYRVEIYGRNVTNNLTPTGLQRGSTTLYNAAGDNLGSPSAIVAALPDKATYGLRASLRF
jgi:iron complex outermembrane receptor protein